MFLKLTKVDFWLRPCTAQDLREATKSFRSGGQALCQRTIRTGVKKFQIGKFAQTFDLTVFFFGG